MIKVKLIILLALLFQTVAHAQTIPATDSLLARQYMQKSRDQKNFATAFVVVGGVVGIVGGYIWFISPMAGLSEHGDVEGARLLGQRMTAVGVGLIGISIPLFIASDKNRKKARLYLGTTQTYLPFRTGTNQLSVGIRLQL